uniref:Uncharacterized protein n=1 Tax=Candidatus Methanophagaceae archaeon ANME-1 ERB6 TaxID=2759912 RepID=A0A7G9YZ41_9EURY|nr:hypothetical protein BKBCGLBC_00036 [Methanosarcinales archaeon ANME-1 ERB6]
MGAGIGVPLSFAGYYFATSLMKKKPEVRDFVIGTYPLNAYPDSWDFVVDNYDIILKSIWHSQKRL